LRVDAIVPFTDHGGGKQRTLSRLAIAFFNPAKGNCCPSSSTDLMRRDRDRLPRAVSVAFMSCRKIEIA
jgi:hypothetical protein